jgi:hypothetical protein
MRIRQGEQTKGFKEVLEDLERKTSGKPKKDKKSMAIDLGTQSANVPTISEGPPKTEVSTQKSSGSNNKKAMAVVPVNYVAEEVAEGGSPKKQSMKEKIKEAKKLGAIAAEHKRKALDTDLGKKLTQDLAELETELKSYTNELARLHRKLGGVRDSVEDTNRYDDLKVKLIPGQKKKVNAIKEELETLVKEAVEGGAKEKEKIGEVEKELRRLTKKLEPLVFALDQEYQKMGGRKEGATLGKTEHQRQLMKEADEIADQLAAVRDKHIRVYSGTFRVQISNTHTATYKYLRLLDGHIEGTDDKSYWTRLDKYFDDASKNTIEIKDKEVIVNRMKLTPKKKLGAKDYSIQIHNV